MSQSQMLKIASKDMVENLSDEQKVEFQKAESQLDEIFENLYNGSDEEVLPVVALSLMGKLLEFVE